MAWLRAGGQEAGKCRASDLVTGGMRMALTDIGTLADSGFKFGRADFEILQGHLPGRGRQLWI